MSKILRDFKLLLSQAGYWIFSSNEKTASLPLCYNSHRAARPHFQENGYVHIYYPKTCSITLIQVVTWREKRICPYVKNKWNSFTFIIISECDAILVDTEFLLASFNL